MALAIPALGAITASSERVFGQAWLWVAIGLTAAAAVVLGAMVIPAQQRLLSALATDHHVGHVEELLKTVQTLSMTTGLFGAVWVAVAVLMVWKPGAPS